MTNNLKEALKNEPTTGYRGKSALLAEIIHELMLDWTPIFHEAMVTYLNHPEEWGCPEDIDAIIPFLFAMDDIERGYKIEYIPTSLENLTDSLMKAKNYQNQE